MTVTEYTPARAEALNMLKIPEIESPLNLRILWFDTILSDDRKNTIYTEPHAHSFFEIHFVFEGEVTYECNKNTIRLTADQALLIPPHIPHCYVESNTSFCKMSLAFSLDEYASSMLQELQKCRTFSFSENISQNVNFILKQSEENDFFSPILIRNRILEIFYCVCKSLGILLPENQSKTIDSRLSVAKQYIKDNRNRLITCEDVAKECCLSRKQLNRIFKKDSGETLHDYIVNVRLKYAKELLLQTKQSIKEISFMLGFENESSFISFFKRHSDIPPGTYRTEYLLENPTTSPKKINTCPD